MCKKCYESIPRHGRMRQNVILIGAMVHSNE